MAVSGLIDPLGSSSEHFRALRMAMDLVQRRQWTSMLLFTSPSRGEGTTTLALNHALVTAATPRRTLLIDANLHRPKLHERLGRSRGPGLMEVLRGDCALGEAVQPVSHPQATLELLASGARVQRTADVLGSQRMAELLRTAAGEFDAVIVDSPPALELPDAAAIAALWDIATLIVADAHQRRQRLARTIARLERVNATLLGIVLNRTASGSV
jgi:capsular exopolysaccharide synthesis family protein